MKIFLRDVQSKKLLFITCNNTHYRETRLYLEAHTTWLNLNTHTWTSLVAQWLRIRLPMQGTWIQSLVRKDPTCRGATKPMRHNYWACALQPASHNYWACTLEPTSHNYWGHMPQLLKPMRLESVLHNKRSHRNEKPAHCNKEWPPLCATREEPMHSNKDPTQPKQKNYTHTSFTFYAKVSKVRISFPTIL